MTNDSHKVGVRIPITPGTAFIEMEVPIGCHGAHPGQSCRESAESGPETYVSWSDDGVILQCEREECMQPGRYGRLYWYSKEMPYKATPEMLVVARDAHVRSHA